jgi:dipeptidyl aminopeptidase/acylaminoacyl peptidase
VNVDDGATTWWSPESGTAFWPAWSPDGNMLVYAWGDALTPREIWAVAAKDGASRQVSHGVRGVADTSSLVRPERLTYPGVGGLPIDTLLYLPPADRANGSGILWVHGGPNWMVRDAYDPFLQYLVGVEGYALLAPNVRGSTGYGRVFMDMNTGDYGGVDQDDWIAGVEVLVQQGGARRDRIAIWGRSYGGFATMMSLCRYPDTFRCGVAQFGVCDWHELWDGATPWVRRLMAHQLGHPQRDHALYRDRSPLTHVGNIRAPILLLHGDADAGVPPAQSLLFAKALAAQNHPHELYVYPGEGHGFNEPHHVFDAASRITSFYDRYLRP